MNNKFHPLLSVVIIGRNEGARLTKCFESVKQMNFPQKNVELIYVDSSSTDDSIQRAGSFGATIISEKTEKRTAALARNHGWKAARGEFVLFLDGDTVLHRDFVSTCLPRFSEPKIGAISGILREASPKQSFYNRVFDLDWNQHDGHTDFFGGNVIIRRNVLEEVQGYNPLLLAAEDTELYSRIKGRGYSTLQLDIPMALHNLNMTSFSQYWTRCFRTGYAYASISHLFREHEQPLFRKEATHNRIKGSLILVSSIGLFGASIVLGSFLPLLFFISVVGLLLLRTALKARTKTSRPLLRIQYGIHSHFQHIPMLFGQAAFWYDNLQKVSRNLIEYK